MSLTLFPITALLFLLSGVGTPLHATGYMETMAALGRQFSGSGATLPHRLQAASRALAHAGVMALPGSLLRAPYLRGNPVVAKVRVSAARRKQYRTRFGFAEGAYLAVGPPAAGNFARCG